MQVSPLSVSSTTGSLDQSIVRAVLDQYRQTYAEMKQTFMAQPLAQDMQSAPSQESFESFATMPGMQEAASAFMSDAVKTQQVDVLRVKSSSTVRYFYALMGFASLMSITVAICAVSATREHIGSRCAAANCGCFPHEANGGHHSGKFRCRVRLLTSSVCVHALCAGR